MGPCGLTFANGDVHGLADRLGKVLTDKSVFAGLRQGAGDHLKRHQRKVVAAAYLNVMREMVGQ